MPGGLYPHSEVGSGGLGCHDDHARLLGQPHSRVEQAHQPVFHHPDDGHGVTMAKMRLQGRGCSSGGMAGRGRCGSEATCSSRALRRSLLRSGWGVGMGVDSQSVGGDDEDRRLLDLSEHVRHLLVVPVISPDHPDPAARCLNGPTPALSAPRAGPTASRPGPLTPPVQRPSGARADVRSSGLSLAGVDTAGSLISTGGYGNSGLTTASPSRAAISQSRWSAQTKWSMGAV